MFDLDGKRVVITGAGGGVGAALVARFDAAGAQVVACDMAGAALEVLPVAETHLFDITDRAAVQQAARDIEAAGGADVVISNAGWTRAETVEGLTPEKMDHEIDLNFRGAADLTLALLPGLRDRPGGASLVFVSSVNALMHFGNPAYSVAKAGLNAWARGLAAEEGRHGIRANVITPGSIRTATWDHRVERDPTILDRVAGFFPIGRMVQPEEVANAALFLASPLSSGITGVTLPVDGGLTSAYLPFVRELA
jgi:NAD(P)-dependent dehydrogenase (short-subunit alcohol dehydrogenase family)